MAARRSIIHSSLFRPSSTLLRQPLATSSIRPLSVSSRSLKDKYPDNLSTDDSVKTDQYPDDEHAVKKADKGVDHDVQSSNVKAGRDAKGSGTGGHATEGKDSAGGVEKAKREHPEAPDPAIGMQDERGGRGG